jgi:hypothetical protein
VLRDNGHGRAILKLSQQRVDPTGNLVPERAHLCERHARGILKLPVDIALSRDVRTLVPTAHRHDQVGPLGVGSLETMRLGVRELDSDLPHDLDHFRMNPLRGPRARRTCLVPSGLLAEEALRDLRASRVLDADEEDVRYFGTASSL